MEKKIKLLKKIAEAGYKSEDAIANLGMDKVLAIPGITVPDMQEILKLQAAIKQHKTLTWLMN